jgi:hypothetical protein
MTGNFAGETTPLLGRSDVVSSGPWTAERLPIARLGLELPD